MWFLGTWFSSGVGNDRYVVGLCFSSLNNSVFLYFDLTNQNLVKAPHVRPSASFFLLAVSRPEDKTGAQLCGMFMLMLSKVQGQQDTSLL